MSTAILFSGQIRSYEATYGNQRAMVYRRFPDAHFIFVLQADEAVEPALAQLRKDYPDRVHVRQLPDPVLEVSDLVKERWFDAPYANAAPPHQLLLQHWFQSQAWRFMAEVENTLGTVFETIVRLRTDLWFRSFEWCREREGWSNFSATAYTPWFAEFGGVNDRCAILGRASAFAYFTVFEQIPALLANGETFHPESLVCAALESAGCDVRSKLVTEFDTWRPKGQPPKQGEYVNAFGYAVRPAEILPWDIAHAALRAA